MSCFMTHYTAFWLWKTGSSDTLFLKVVLDYYQLKSDVDVAVAAKHACYGDDQFNGQ